MSSSENEEINSENEENNEADEHMYIAHPGTSEEEGPSSKKFLIRGSTEFDKIFRYYGI